MTDNVYFNRGGKAVGTDSTDYDGGYHSVVMMNLPKGLDVVGMTEQEIKNSTNEKCRAYFSGSGHRRAGKPQYAKAKAGSYAKR